MEEKRTESQPLISVVLTTYNRKDFLKKAIKTVLEQTYLRKELIVIDDCSKEDPIDIIEQFDFPIVYHRQEQNSGISAARNKGISLAKGKFVTFLDDDDLWITTKLERQLKYMDGVDANLCAAQVQDSDNTIIHNLSEVSHEQLKLGNNFANPSALMVRKSVLQEYSFDEELSFAEDWDFIFRLSRKFKIGYCKEPLLLYNRGDHVGLVNAAKYLSIEALEERLKAINKHRHELGDWYYKKRTASIALAFIFSKENKMDFLVYSMKKAGIVATLELLIRKLLRRERKIFK